MGRKRAIGLSLVGISLLTSGVVAKHFWRGETMATKNVCKNWGEAPFQVDRFRLEDEVVRAKMACSLLKNQKLFIGKDRAQIRNELGDHDGFYFSDMFPAYMIQSAKSKGEDSWQLVFLIDRKEKVSEIIVHKNCCDH